jgi:hypothetical protein
MPTPAATRGTRLRTHPRTERPEAIIHHGWDAPTADLARALPRPCAYLLPVCRALTPSAHPDSWHSTGTGALAQPARGLLSQATKSATSFTRDLQLPSIELSGSATPESRHTLCGDLPRRPHHSSTSISIRRYCFFGFRAVTTTARFTIGLITSSSVSCTP